MKKREGIFTESDDMDNPKSIIPKVPKSVSEAEPPTPIPTPKEFTVLEDPCGDYILTIEKSAYDEIVRQYALNQAALLKAKEEIDAYKDEVKKMHLQIDALAQALANPLIHRLSGDAE